MKKIETLAIGDELLTGRISDTNSTFIANQIFALGFRLDRQTVIPDDKEVIRKTLLDAAERAEVVICFGGLGPTSDDKTAEVIAEILGCELVIDAPSRERLEKYYASRNRPVTPQALKQVLFPKAATALSNQAGMAPGIFCQIKKAKCFFLPGVPREMKTIFADHILPLFRAESGEIRSKTWRCIGIWESDLQRQMDDLEGKLPAGAFLGYRTRFPENHLTLYFPKNKGEKEFEHWSQSVRALLAPWSYTEEDKELEELIRDCLLKKGMRVALAESCTGGLCTQRLSRLPGASQWLWGGATVYQVDAKKRLLGVDLSNPNDAVSESCTRTLSQRLRALSGCEVTAAITGYLGPTGGDEKSPVGTIYLAVNVPEGEREPWREKRVVLPIRPREEAQWGASTYLLHLLYEAVR